MGKLPTKFTEPIAFIDGIDAGSDTVKLLICDGVSICSICEVESETKSIKMSVLNLITDKQIKEQNVTVTKINGARIIDLHTAIIATDEGLVKWNFHEQ